MDDLSDELIKEFQEVVNRKYGENLSFTEASIILHDLSEYFHTLYKIKCRIDE